MMYESVIGFHMVVSALFILLGMVTTVWAIRGWSRKASCPRSFLKLSWTFIHVLYLQLITGVVLYFFLKPEPASALLSMEEAMSQDRLRFWAIEHVSLMLFSLCLAQVGRLVIKQISTDWKKYRAATFYYGISLLMTLVSATMGILR